MPDEKQKMKEVVDILLDAAREAIKNDLEEHVSYVLQIVGNKTREIHQRIDYKTAKIDKLEEKLLNAVYMIAGMSADIKELKSKMQDIDDELVGKAEYIMDRHLAETRHQYV